MAPDDPTLVGKRWRAGYDLIQNGLALKSDFAGLQKATPPIETSTVKHFCHYHCLAGYAQGTLTVETCTICISTGSGIGGDQATWITA